MEDINYNGENSPSSILEGTLRVHRISHRAKLPTRGTSGAAGLDLYSPISTTIRKNTSKLISLDLSFEFPKGYYGKIETRSSMAQRNIIVTGGVIDEDYRGNIKVLLYNLGEKDYRVFTGDRIGQMIISQYFHPSIYVVTTLNETERGENGFGMGSNVLRNLHATQGDHNQRGE
jgi:dUTP pyrophosphatase